MIHFEWDENKNSKNIKKHGINLIVIMNSSINGGNDDEREL